MKYNVIKKNKSINIICGICLLLAIPVIVLFLLYAKFRNDTDKMIGIIGLSTLWFAFFIAWLGYVLWKISFNDEEFKVRHFFFTKKYKRDNVIAIDESRAHRAGFRDSFHTFFEKYYAIHTVIRRKDNNRLIAEIHDHYAGSQFFNELKTLPKNKKFMMSYKHDKTTPEDFGLVERDGRYFSKKDNSEWIKHPMFDYGYGPEDGFYKLPLGSFNDLVSFIEGNYKKEDQSLCAAVMMMEMNPSEVKKYLLKVIKNNINSDYRKFLSYAFVLDAFSNKNILEDEYKEWEHIGRCLNGEDFVVYEATLVWVSPENGGRKGPVPMENNKYAPLIGIKGQMTFDGCAWSTICYNYEETSEFTTRAYLRFLNYEKAPNILSKGTVFELYEGNKKVASGIVEKIISDDEDILDIFTY